MLSAWVLVSWKNSTGTKCVINVGTIIWQTRWESRICVTYSQEWQHLTTSGSDQSAAVLKSQGSRARTDTKQQPGGSERRSSYYTSSPPLLEKRFVFSALQHNNNSSSVSHTPLCCLRGLGEESASAASKPKAAGHFIIELCLCCCGTCSNGVRLILILSSAYNVSTAQQQQGAESSIPSMICAFQHF